MLVDEVHAALAIRAGGYYVDATFGRGGHTARILETLGGEGRLLALDRDPQAIAAGRQRFAGELRRVGRGWFVQTPAFSFPLEPHALLPAAHWLPVPLRKRYWRFGAAGDWEEISLLRRAELERLFGPALAERVGPLVKSWVCVRAPDGR